MLYLIIAFTFKLPFTMAHLAMRKQVNRVGLYMQSTSYKYRLIIAASNKIKPRSNREEQFLYLVRKIK